MNSDDYAELRSDMARAMNLADAKKVMKKFLRKAGPGYLEDCPVVNNSGMRKLFQSAALELAKETVPLPKVRSCGPSKQQLFGATYSNVGEPVIGWIYFNDMKKGVLTASYSELADRGGCFSQLDFWQ